MQPLRARSQGPSLVELSGLNDFVDGQVRARNFVVGAQKMPGQSGT